eukprot:gb/GECG01000056.1/.p1 GENE.gb/GECG01000056.1/~~gb/GECG01000056.1/.p1  ORF type:complete len:1117 (+),score=110.79 gb/GECG01000056.1/:1-3351(+)
MQIRSQCLGQRGSRCRLPWSWRDSKTPLAARAAASSSSTTYTISDESLKRTLQLPWTSFPMRANASVREPQFQERITTDLYRTQRTFRTERPEFTLHDGPPYANGALHMGHFVNKVLKDIINRDKLLDGYWVNYVPGWDCHGLPIELKAVENLNSSLHEEPVDHEAKLKQANTIRKAAAEHAKRTIEDQTEGFKRWGVLADWSSTEHTYRTMDASYESNELEVFQQLWKNGVVFRGVKPVYWSPSTQTALAEAELEYQDNHISQQIYASFPLAAKEELTYSQTPWDPTDTLSKIANSVEEYCKNIEIDVDCSDFPVAAAIWTTTPWTIPANVAIAIAPDQEYSVIAVRNEQGFAFPSFFLVACELKDHFVHQVSAGISMECFAEDICTLEGRRLAGLQCLHPLSGCNVGCERTSVIVPADYVTMDNGTGLVHTAPGHGVDDWYTIEKLNSEHSVTPEMPVICPVNDRGQFSSDVRELEGKEVLNEGNNAVMELLKKEGYLLHSTEYAHRYPYDWRSKQPVIIRATSQWFINVKDAIAQSLLAVGNIRLVPESGINRLQAMLQSRTEWCISRQRPWGVPIPVLYHRDTDEPLLTEESIENIKSLISKNGTDYWWQAPMSELLPHSMRTEENAKLYRRGMDTFDVWFDSGSSWASVWDRSGSGESLLVKGKRSDVVVEGSDQHRGWFQSSLLIAIAAEFGVPFSNIVTHGFVLDPQALKMSKSIGNVVAPSDIIDGAPKQKKGIKGKYKKPLFNVPYGVDVGRWWVASTDYSRDIVLSPDAVAKSAESLRRVRNTAKFLLSNLNGYMPKFFDTLNMERVIESKARIQSAWTQHARDSPVLDINRCTPVQQFALNRLAALETEITAAYSNFNFARVIAAVTNFVTNDLSSRYLEFVKDRLYCQHPSDPLREQTQAILWESLVTLVNGIAPIACYTAEDIFQHSVAMITKEGDENEGKDWTLNPCTSMSVFHLTRRAIPSTWHSESIATQWDRVLRARNLVHRLLEEARTRKLIGSPLDACVYIDTLEGHGDSTQPLMSIAESLELAEVMGTSQAVYNGTATFNSSSIITSEESTEDNINVILGHAQGQKCRRCWQIQLSVSSDGNHLCSRCRNVVEQLL